MDFTDKVVLITGASSGIGAATAELFAKHGAKVAIVGRNVENLEATKSACILANACCECLQIAADVTVDTERIVAVTLSKFNRIDILINNAGILASGGILDADVEQYDNILNTNLRAVFLLTKLCVPHLIKTQGTIINVSSVAGLRSFSGALNYCVSKAALDQFTKCVALDLAPLNVRVNAVNPGVVVTDIHKRAGMSEDEYEKYLERSKGTHAMGRVGNVFEVAETILFLASPGASFITGACVPIDGGKHAMCPR